jgi:hypothetical protein
MHSRSTSSNFPDADATTASTAPMLSVKELKYGWAAIAVAIAVATVGFRAMDWQHPFTRAPSANWCVPARLTTMFEGNWRGLTLWGQLPADGRVKGRASVIHNSTHSLLYFRYSVAPDALQEQWAIWIKGDKVSFVATLYLAAGVKFGCFTHFLLQHVTIGKNTTFFTLPNGTQYSASSCVLIEEGKATKDNDPGFCAKTGEVQMQFNRHGELSCHTAAGNGIFSSTFTNWK